jgi:hypothetical protein
MYAMDKYERENVLNRIREEINKTDIVYRAFINDFVVALYPFVAIYYPAAKPSKAIDEVLNAYAVATFNSTETVIDKDRSYPLYRLEEEVNTMSHLLQKLYGQGYDASFANVVVDVVKRMMVAYFAGVYNLSGNGFRLLEMNARLYGWEFHANLQAVLTPGE